MARHKAKAVYLDHSVVNQFAHASDGGFTRTKLADAIQNASDGGRAEIWASPTSVAEILLCTRDDDALAKRQRMAQCLVQLIEAGRMLLATPFRLAREFLRCLDQHAPGAVQFAYLDANELTNKQLWLGVLGLLAAYRELILPVEAREALLRPKFETKLRVHRILQDPELLMDPPGNVNRRSIEDIRFEFDSKSIEDLEAEVEIAKVQTIRKIDKKTKNRLKRQKKGAVSRFGEDECLLALIDAFNNDLELFASFNAQALGAAKAVILKLIGGHESRTELEANLARCADAVIAPTRTIELLVRGIAGTHLLNVQLVMEYLLGELAESWKEGKGSTPGVTYDADHLLALPDVDVFVTTDGRMAKIARKLVPRIEKMSGRRAIVAQNEKQLQKALE